jgi:hypothetical protein
MPLFIYSLLNRNGLKFGYGPSRVMISDEFDVTRVTLSDCRAEWFRPVMAVMAGIKENAAGQGTGDAKDARKPIAAQP